MVQRALEGLDGVESAAVTYEPPEAVVTYDPGAVTIQDMAQALEKYGFGIEEAEKSGSTGTIDQGQ